MSDVSDMSDTLDFFAPYYTPFPTKCCTLMGTLL